MFQAIAAGSERVGRFARRDGVAAPHGTVFFEVRFLSPQVPTREAEHCYTELTRRSGVL